MKINCFCKNKGWLFFDLQKKFEECGITTSENPIESDLWICIRTSEALNSPNIKHTVVQVHDVYEYNIDFFNEAKCIIFTHPIQHFLWKTKGFKGNYKIIPIGSRKNIPIDFKKPDIPTIGFYCKETKRMEKGSQIFKNVILRAKQKIEFNVLMIGKNLNHIEQLGQYEERAADIYDYARIDALFTSSISPAIPLSIYEALSIGKPIVSTPRWFTFSSTLIHQGYNEIELSEAVVKVIQNRNYYYDNRHNFKISPFFLEDWIEKNIEACYE